jgi:sugar lactone lactonase YvrE
MPTPFGSRTTRLVAVAALAIAAPSAALAQGPDRIDLPPGWQPEGITSDGTTLYAGSLADGAIWKGDAATGEGMVLAPGADGRVTVGVDIDPGSGVLWAAGGPTGQVHAFDAESGELLETYQFEAGFLNDVAITPEAVYVTDSFVPQLIAISLPEDGSVPMEADAAAMALSGDLEYGDGFNLNGIVSTDIGLVVVHSPTGGLYRVDPDTAQTSSIDTGGADLTAGDGLELLGSSLYVVRNQLNQVAVVELAEDLTSGELVDTITADDLDVPTTVAYVDGSLWAANARFGTDATPDTEYWLTRIDATVNDG